MRPQYRRGLSGSRVDNRPRWCPPGTVPSIPADGAPGHRQGPIFLSVGHDAFFCGCGVAAVLPAWEWGGDPVPDKTDTRREMHGCMETRPSALGAARPLGEGCAGEGHPDSAALFCSFSLPWFTPLQLFRGPAASPSGMRTGNGYDEDRYGAGYWSGGTPLVPANRLAPPIHLAVPPSRGGKVWVRARPSVG